MAEPLIYRRRQQTVSWVRNGHWTSRGYWRRHVVKDGCGTRETLPGCLRRVKTARIRGRPKSCGAGRESEGLIVLRKAVRSRWREGALLWLGWNVVVDADIRGYFDNIDQAKLILQDGKLGCQIQSGGQLCMEPGNPLAVAARRTAYTLSLRPLAVQRLWDMGLYRLQGAVKYPTNATSRKLIGKPCAGKSHAWFERRRWKRAAASGTVPVIDQ